MFVAVPSCNEHISAGFDPGHLTIMADADMMCHVPRTGKYPDKGEDQQRFHFTRPDAETD